MKNRTCYYFDDIIKLEDFDIDNILIDEKLQENILIYDIFFAYWFDKIDGFIEIYNGTRYLILFGSEKYDAIYNRIRKSRIVKSSITYIFSHYYAKIKVDSNGSLPIEKRLFLHNVIILIKSVLNKDKNHYYSKQLAKK